MAVTRDPSVSAFDSQPREQSHHARDAKPGVLGVLAVSSSATRRTLVLGLTNVAAVRAASRREPVDDEM